MRLTTRKLTGPVAAMTVLAAIAAAPAMAGGGGEPTVEREVIHETFFDDYIFDICGVETDTTHTQRTTIKTFPDGSETVHRIAEWVPDDPGIASERWGRTTGSRPTARSRLSGSPSGSTGREKGRSSATPDGSGSSRTGSWSAARTPSSTPTPPMCSADSRRTREESPCP
jgi:hypothetical protein